MTTERKTEIELSYIMPVFFNQKDTDVLINLLKAYSKFDIALLQKIQFIIVDDCSPIEIKIPESINLNYSIYRITTDITWNQGGARNLGVTQAVSPKIILTDCDHFFPENILAQIVKSKIPQKVLYKFKRKSFDGKSKTSPCNIFYTSKSVFFSVLGYDEEFCGHYGFEDVMFRMFQKRAGNSLRYFTRWKKIISNTIDRENSYHSLDRNTSTNSKLMEKKLAASKKDLFKGHSRLFLNFEYKKVAEKWINI